MQKNMKKIITEKAQGLTEYVLILAFIAGVAFAMFGGDGSLKGTLVNTFTRTVDILAGLFDENYGYVTASKNYTKYFNDWRDESSEHLAEISPEERLKADREGLASIASLFLNLTQDQVAELMGVGANNQNQGYSNTFGSAPSWLTTNLDANRMGPVNDGWSEIMVPLSYWNTDFDTDGYIWLEASKNVNLIKDMAGAVDQPITATKNNVKVTDENGTEWKRTGLTDRVFYSDGMIGSDSSNRAVTVQVHYNGDTVDQVRVQAVKGELKLEKNKTVEGRYNLSPGNNAINGQPEPVSGLDLTVTGSRDNYKYKVN